MNRNKLRTKIIAVTGSSGKTTTKDMIHSILSQSADTLKTHENFNNEIGVPLTLLKLTKKHKYAVIEMGMQGLNEIKELSDIARPNIAVLTNIGEAHLGLLKTKRNIALAKSEILKFLEHKDFVVLNADDPYFDFLKKQNKKVQIISYGLRNKADIQAVNIRENNDSVVFDILINFSMAKKFTSSPPAPLHRVERGDPAKAGWVRKGSFFAIKKIHIPLPGKHNIYNALAAIAVGLICNFNGGKIARGLSKFKPSSKRMDIFTTKGKVKIINDAYNANPSSVKSALQVLSLQKTEKGGRRIAIFGDMLELGKKSKYFHNKIGEEFNKSGADILIAIGSFAKDIYKSAKKHAIPNGQYFYFKNKSNAIPEIIKIIKPHDAVLVKASRALKLEDVVQYIL